MSAVAEGLTAPERRALRGPTAIAFAVILVVVAAAISLGLGPVRIAPGTVLDILLKAIGGATQTAREAVVVLDVRLPRTVLGMLVGAATASAGAVMQGLFRNPLADPSVVGVSGGAAVAAAAWIVLGAGFAAAIPFGLGAYGLPFAAFLGGLLVTVILHLIATRDGRTSIFTMLLAGIALSGLTGSLTGFIIFLSSEQQLREFTFWTLGSIGSATWAKIVMVLPFAVLLAIIAPFLARALDALSLGESEAFHLGVSVERVKRLAILAVAGAIGASVAVSGIIGFFGLTVPHLVRPTLGPGHRLLLPVSALLGAALLVLADVIARTVASPAELPLGVITAGVGAPVMLWLLMNRRNSLLG
jgi:iron complex transport system permease protein